MARFYCNPYDTSKNGFYFDDYEEFEAKIADADFEEYQIDCVDYEHSEVFNYLYKHNTDKLEDLIEFLDGLDDDEMTAVCYLTDRNFYDLDDIQNNYAAVVMYDGSAEDYAEELVNDGVFGEIPDSISNYIDYEAIARDLLCGGDIEEWNGFVITNPNEF